MNKIYFYILLCVLGSCGKWNEGEEPDSKIFNFEAKNALSATLDDSCMRPQCYKVRLSLPKEISGDLAHYHIVRFNRTGTKKDYVIEALNSDTWIDDDVVGGDAYDYQLEKIDLGVEVLQQEKAHVEIPKDLSVGFSIQSGLGASGFQQLWTSFVNTPGGTFRIDSLGGTNTHSIYEGGRIFFKNRAILSAAEKFFSLKVHQIIIDQEASIVGFDQGEHAESEKVGRAGGDIFIEADEVLSLNPSLTGVLNVVARGEGGGGGRPGENAVDILKRNTPELRNPKKFSILPFDAGILLRSLKMPGSPGEVGLRGGDSGNVCVKIKWKRVPVHVDLLPGAGGAGGSGGAGHGGAPNGEVGTSGREGSRGRICSDS